MSKSARELFRDRVSDISPELFEQLYDIATGAMKTVSREWVCDAPRPGGRNGVCGKRHREVFQVEDQAARLKAIDMLAQHGWGRPAQVAPEKDSSELLAKDVEDMSDKELSEYLALLKTMQEED